MGPMSMKARAVSLSRSLKQGISPVVSLQSHGRGGRSRCVHNRTPPLTLDNLAENTVGERRHRVDVDELAACVVGGVAS